MREEEEVCNWGWGVGGGGGGEEREVDICTCRCVVIIPSMNSQARFPDGHRLLFPVKLSQVREVGLAEAKLDTSVVLSHGVWTGTYNLVIA